MNGVLVDSNIIIDVFTEDEAWFEWSSSMLTKYSDKTTLFINKIIYSEISLSFKKIEDLEQALPSELLQRDTIPWEAAFLAGKVFQKYKKNGGARLLPLPDFFIGAHASINNYAMLTRDDKIYKTYFPRLDVISPQYF